MKTFENFLGEALEISELSGGYRIVTLLKHDGLDLANMTEDEFVRLMSEDLKQVHNEYERVRIPERASARAKAIDREIERAQKYADQKYKTQRKRDEYMAKFKANIEKNYEIWDQDQLFFDFKPGVGNSLPIVCVLKPNTDEYKLRQCYEELVKSRWWKKGTGWAFKYEAGKHDLATHFRPWIELIMNESDAARRRKEQQMLDDGIAAYYASAGSSRYTGD